MEGHPIRIIGYLFSQPLQHFEFGLPASPLLPYLFARTCQIAPLCVHLFMCYLWNQARSQTHEGSNSKFPKFGRLWLSLASFGVGVAHVDCPTCDSGEVISATLGLSYLTRDFHSGSGLNFWLFISLRIF